MMANGMRFESIADMPQGMRKKVVPHIVAGLKKGEKNDGPIIVDGIRFRNKEVAARYSLLMQAASDGYIRDLHVYDEIPYGNFGHTVPGTGERVKGKVFTADFSYLVADIWWTDRYPAEDLELWEAMEQYPKLRVYEVVHKKGEQIPEKPIMPEPIRDVII